MRPSPLLVSYAAACVLSGCASSSAPPHAGSLDAAPQRTGGAPALAAGSSIDARSAEASAEAGAAGRTRSQATGHGGRTASAGGSRSEGPSGGGGLNGAGTGGQAAGSTAPRIVSFTTGVLSSDHSAEGAAIDDINGDRRLYLIAGPRWYAGPGFELGGTLIADPPKLGMDQYSVFFHQRRWSARHRDG